MNPLVYHAMKVALNARDQIMMNVKIAIQVGIWIVLHVFLVGKNVWIARIL